MSKTAMIYMKIVAVFEQAKILHMNFFKNGGIFSVFTSFSILYLSTGTHRR